MKRCKQCNSEYDNRDNCPNCGSVEFWEVDVWGQPHEPQSQPVNLSKENTQNEQSAQNTPPPYQPPQPQQNYNQQQAYSQVQSQVQQDNGAKGMGVAAMVLGILSLILFLVPFVGLGMGILALCLGVAAKKKLPDGEQGMATAGVVLGIIGIILGAIASVIAASCAAMVSSALWNFTDPSYWRYY